MTREDLVKIARIAIAGVHRPPDLENPVTYDPDEWMVEALAAAWKAGSAERSAARSADVVDVVELAAYFVDAAMGDRNVGPPAVRQTNPNPRRSVPRRPRANR